MEKSKSCLEIEFSMATAENKIASKRAFFLRKANMLAPGNVISLHQAIWHGKLKVILEQYYNLT